MDVQLVQLMGDVVDKPERFFLPETAMACELLELTRSLFSIAKSTEPVSLDPLSEFIIDGFNHDQVWEELQLRNEPTVSYLRKQFKKLEKIEPEKENEEDNRQSELDEEAMFNMLMRGEGSNVDNENIGSMEDSDGDLSGLDDEDEMNKGEYSDDGEEMDEGQYSDDGEEMDELDEGEFSRDASLMDESETDHVHSVDDTEAKAVEDDFFSLEEMERFANQELDENDDIDYAQDPDAMIDDEDGLEDKDERDEEFSEYGDDEKAANLTYADFFAPPKTDRQKKRKVEYRANDDEDYGSFGEEEEPMKDDESLTENADAAIAVKDLFNQNDENDDTAKSLSSFEREQLRMQKNIEQLEEENIQEKSWQMKGEVNAKKRPINSLLEEDLDFDQGSKPVPIITEEVTQSLEEIIKARILDGTWDDVERCLAPAELAALVNRPRKQIEISDEKSKKSLAEEYEDEYQKQKRLQTDPNHDSRSEELKKEHREIESMYKSLCGKLDALSNWHFTPKAGHSEMKITATTTETPAIEMEEIIPVHVSDGQLLAPHEVYEPKKSELSLKSKEEMTSQEKDKLRRAKKQEVRKEKNRREQDKKLMGKLNPGMGNRHSRENALKMLDGHKNVSIIGSEGKKRPSQGKQQEISSGTMLKL